MMRNLLLIGMPAWNVDYPFHALTYVGGIIKQAGWRCRQADLNISIHNMAHRRDADLWYPPYQARWYSMEVTRKIYIKYRNEIEAVLCGLMEEDEYDLIAFTVNISTKNMSLLASRFIKSVLPDTPILFGGVECFPPASGHRLLYEEGAPDLICLGEAETALPAYLKRFEESGEPRLPVKGFAYLFDGKVTDNGEPDLPALKDGCPTADLSLTDFSQYRRPGDFAVFSSRGCPYRCVFCTECRNFKRYRQRNPLDVVNEIIESLRYASKYSERPTIHFSDSLINGSILRLEKMCDLILDRRISIQWEGQARFSPRMTQSLLEKMRKAGCSSLLWGLETGSQRVIDLMGKSYDLEVAETNLKDAHRVGITNKTPLIVGFPGETTQDFISTVVTCLRIGPYTIFEGVEPLSILKGSELYRSYSERGLTDNSDHQWATLDGKNNLDVRLLRRFTLINALENGSLLLHSATALNELDKIDFNDPSVAAELLDLLYGFYKWIGDEAELKNLLESFDGGGTYRTLDPEEPTPNYPLPCIVPGNINLIGWYSQDKNSNDMKAMLVNLLFEALREIRQDVSNMHAD